MTAHMAFGGPRRGDDASDLLRQLLGLAPAGDDEAFDLLRSLLNTPVPSPEEGLRPAVLRSLSAQRRLARRGGRKRDRLDAVLLRSSQALALASLLTLGYWAADGPVRDWLRAPAPARPAARGALVNAAAPQPFVVAVTAPRSRSPLPPIRRPYAPNARDELRALRPSKWAAAARPARRTDAVAGNDFLAPQPMAIVREPATDLRPSHLRIPAIEVDAAVYEVAVADDTWNTADYAAGFLEGTSLPGAWGNVGIAGHAGLRGGVFRRLPSLAQGDDVYVDAGGWLYHYRVREAKTIWPNQIEILDPTLKPTLTLLTCTNWDLQRLAVIADLVAAYPVGAGR